jgi:hypothetical protein
MKYRREVPHTNAPGKKAASTNPMKNLESRAPTKLRRINQTLMWNAAARRTCE